MSLIFTKSSLGLRAVELPKREYQNEVVLPNPRKSPLELPEISQVELIRHYTKLSKMAYGVDDGFYPLGSCTMKYNPKINEETASLPGFLKVHPLQDQDTLKGSLSVVKELKESLCEITGMDDFTLAPAAGAQGEFVGLLLVRAYHEYHKDEKRNIVLIPDSAHGTNPASANMCGYQVVNVPSKDGLVDFEALKSLVDDRVACLMLTNPNTLGLFEKDIKKMADLVHQAGGLLYYDGANLNAIMGVSKPAVMGFDIVHLNLHKTFSTPHGGGGPGAGPVGCVSKLAKFLPNTNEELSVGRVKAFHGNFSVLVKALTYIKVLGGDGLLATSQNAVLNANYMMKKLAKTFEIPYEKQGCMHEFVISAENLKKEKGISALDIAKALIDNGIHPPTVYFPLIVHEALMIEPTETECKERMDDFIATMEAIINDPDIHKHPFNTPVGRLDEVKAARTPVVIYQKK